MLYLLSVYLSRDLPVMMQVAVAGEVIRLDEAKYPTLQRGRRLSTSSVIQTSISYPPTRQACLMRVEREESFSKGYAIIVRKEQQCKSMLTPF